MPFFEGYELLKYALDAETDEKLFMRWVIGYQFDMGFDEFKAEVTTVKTVDDDRTAEEILNSVKEIIGRCRWKFLSCLGLFL